MNLATLPKELLRFIFSFIAIDSALFIFEDLSWFVNCDFEKEEKDEYIDSCLFENFIKTRKTLIHFLLCNGVSTKEIKEKYIANIKITEKNIHLICETNIFTKRKIPESKIENILRNDLPFFKFLISTFGCEINEEIFHQSIVNIEAMIFITNSFEIEINNNISTIVLKRLYENEREKIIPTLEWLISQRVKLLCGCTLFATEKQDLELLKFLFRNGSQIEMMCLQEAIRLDNFEIIEFLVEECNE